MTQGSACFPTLLTAKDQFIQRNRAAISQYLPRQYERVRHGVLDSGPEALVFDRIQDTLEDYAVACRPDWEGTKRR